MFGSVEIVVGGMLRPIVVGGGIGGKNSLPIPLEHETDDPRNRSMEVWILPND